MDISDLVMLVSAFKIQTLVSQDNVDSLPCQNVFGPTPVVEASHSLLHPWSLCIMDLGLFPFLCHSLYIIPRCD
jgi:hypothetical protein